MAVTANKRWRLQSLIAPVTPAPIVRANGTVAIPPLPVQPSNAPPATPEALPTLVANPRTKLRGPGRVTLASNQKYPVVASAQRAGAIVINQSTTVWLTILNDKGDAIFDIPPSQEQPIPSNDAFTVLNDGTGVPITFNLCLVDYD